ncbi:DUF6249 domain-containing protein [Aquimonas sp.]|jgi:hypothetical protein|uniref:DUF6249 domain-containing protein n=1 Tax=Aquimonas sp. TaxID=1872588 RepID=UPI0037C0A345
MDFTLLVPISLFVCIAYVIKSIMDARVRRRIVESSASESLVKSLIEADELARRTSALKWGLVLTSLGAGFGLIEWLKLEADRPGTFGLMFVAAGIGMLAYHLLTQRRS